jgi:signal transduction histidine kinase
MHTVSGFERIHHKQRASNMKSWRAASKGACASKFEPAEHAVSNVIMREALCAYQNEVQRLSAQILMIQENERQRIATDLHDGLGQLLTLIKLGLEECSLLLKTNALVETQYSIQQQKLKVQDAFDELRRIAMDLRPSTLDDLGIIATLSWFLREFESTCRGIKVEKYLMIQENNIPDQIKITIFRILQEATNNIIKHSKADCIRVSLKKAGDTLHLAIEDNGQGFDPEDLDSYCSLGKGLGLVSMKERAHFSGGVYRIDSAISHGTRISVSWLCK